jgi:hypothetical protein
VNAQREPSGAHKSWEMVYLTAQSPLVRVLFFQPVARILRSAPPHGEQWVHKNKFNGWRWPRPLKPRPLDGRRPRAPARKERWRSFDCRGSVGRELCAKLRHDLTYGQPIIAKRKVHIDDFHRCWAFSVALLIEGFEFATLVRRRRPLLQLDVERR